MTIPHSSVFGAHSGLEELMSTYEMRVGDYDEASRYSRLELANSSTGLELTHELREQTVIAKIGHLVDGRLVNVLLPLSATSEMTTFWVDDFVLLRGETDQVEALYSTMTVQKRVGFWCTAVAMFCDDVMRGDFSVFPVIREQFRRRMQSGVR
jgi:hypothetical protein